MAAPLVITSNGFDAPGALRRAIAARAHRLGRHPRDVLSCQVALERLAPGHGRPDRYAAHARVLLPDVELESGFEVLEHAVAHSVDAAVDSVFDAVARRMKERASG